MKYTVEELKNDGFITFGDKQYLPKEYADMILDEVEKLNNSVEFAIKYLSSSDIPQIKTVVKALKESQK